MTIGPAEEGCWTLSVSDMVYAEGFRMALSQEHCVGRDYDSTHLHSSRGQSPDGARTSHPNKAASATKEIPVLIQPQARGNTLNLHSLESQGASLFTGDGGSVST